MADIAKYFPKLLVFEGGFVNDPLDRGGAGENSKIFGILNSKTEEIRYIGVTKNSLRRRLYEHQIEPTKTKKSCWLLSMKRIGVKPVAILLESGLSRSNAFQKEKQYISLFKSFGANLVNLTVGGDSPPNMSGIKRSEETKEKRNKTRPIFTYTIQTPDKQVVEVDNLNLFSKQKGLAYPSLSGTASSVHRYPPVCTSLGTYSSGLSDRTEGSRTPLCSRSLSTAQADWGTHELLV